VHPDWGKYQTKKKETKMGKKYYGAYSDRGINNTWNSECWVLHVFYSTRARDIWVSQNKYNDCDNLVAESVSARVARRIVSPRAMQAIQGDKYPNIIELTYNVVIHRREAGQNE
jgi:hypothetical protein